MLSLCIQWIDKLYIADSFCIYVMYVNFSGTYQQCFNHCLDTNSLQHAGLQSYPFITMQQVKHMVNQGRNLQKERDQGRNKTDIVLPFLNTYKGQQRKVIFKIKNRRKLNFYANVRTYKYKWKKM